MPTREQVENAGRALLIRYAVEVLGGSEDTHRFTKGDTLRASILAALATDDDTRETARAILESSPTPEVEHPTSLSTYQRNATVDAPPAASPVGASDPWAMFAAFLQPHLAVKVDRAEVDALVSERIAALTMPTIVEIRRAESDPVVVETAHPKFARMAAWLGRGRNVYLYGKPGGGKSTAVQQYAHAIGARFGYIALTMQTAESRLFGYLTPDGKTVRTQFRDCYEHGGVFLIDELDNASGNLLTALNGALENGHCPFPDGLVERHPEFRCVATGNTTMRGGTASHSTRSVIDAATPERFVFIEWGYDEALESALVSQANPNAARWLGWVREVRRYCAESFPRIVVSPRAAILGATALAEGDKPEEFLDEVLWKGLDESTVRAITAACPIPPFTA